jgi:ubiquinol-cytochrome c reductase core subunit 2
VDVLSSFITSAKFTRHEFEEYVLPVVVDESIAAGSNPTTRALELAHTVAFRTGLGSPLFANPHHSTVTSEDVKSFAHSVFTKGNVAVLGTGISQDTLSKLVETSVGSASSPLTSVKPSTPSSSYFGGETRVEAHGGPQTIFIGFGTAGTPTPELSVLSTYLSPQPSIKWSRGLSPLSAAIPSGTSVRTVLFPYSDATLFGLLVQGSTVEGVKEAGKAVVKAVKASAPSGGVSVGDLKKAVAKAKFEAASSVDGREGMVSVLGSKVNSRWNRKMIRMFDHSCRY